MNGTVYFVGTGPGDPGLITHRGLELLRRADVVVYEKPSHNSLLLHARSDARRIGVGRNGTHAGRSQRRVCRLIARQVHKGCMIVRLKSGDPFIFGRGPEEVEWLAARQIPFEIVPGVTAALASAAYAGIPLTHRDHASNVTLVTGLLKEGTALAKVPQSGTLAIYMAVKTLPRTMRMLVEQGWDPETPAALIEWGTTPRQRLVVGTVGTLAEKAREARMHPPAVAIVGRVVTLRQALTWFEARPLLGVRIIVTRARDQAGDFASRLIDLGAEVIDYPTIEIKPVPRWRPVDAVLRDIARYDAVLFTSQNTVPIVFERLEHLGMDARALAGVRVGVVGPATAATLKRHGIRPDWMAGEFTVAALGKKIAADLPPGARVLHPGADRRSPLLEKELVKAGVQVRNLDVYRICRPGRRTPVKAADLVTFASAQTARNFAALSKLRPPAACIGPVTSQAARELGFRVVAQAKPYTIPALIEAILRWRKPTENRP
ncbi:MAG: uroporphyrinogen-III C-methyltransferase [Planctomycetes bacterium]|nr:uroporphyrinogen-III C-methyltransferase [Planctomycetota bacterium]